MENFDRKNHWENIYETKQLEEVSWYQPIPEASLSFIKEINLPSDAAIIDIGGGDSFLVDNLLKWGYTNVSVLDISEKAIERAQERLGTKAKNVKWIVSDVTAFEPYEKYDLWHDRAAFHFLTDQNEVARYAEITSRNVNPNGFLFVGTFSENGPKKCSGIDIQQYSEETLSKVFINSFEKIKSFTTDHPTPFGTVQNFVFCAMKKF